MNPRTRAHFLLFTVNIMYAVNYIVAKGLMPNVLQPNGFILWRVLGASTLFWAIYAFNYEKIDRKDYKLSMLCALFGIAINQLFFFNGLMRTSPLNSSIIMTSTPIIVFVLSIFILKERPVKQKIIGILLGAFGSVFLIIISTKGEGSSSILGDLFIFINALSYSLYLVLVKPLMAKYKPLTVITWIFTFGLIYVLLWPYSTIEFMDSKVHLWSTSTISQIAFIIIGVTFLPYLLTVSAMKHLSPSIASSYIYFQPLLASLFILITYYFGATDYTSDFSIWKIIAGGFIFIGVYLVSKKPKYTPAK